jgi:hypothetical protein
MLDAFGVLWSDHVQQLLVQKVMLAADPDQVLILRLFIHVISADLPPVPVRIAQVMHGVQLCLCCNASYVILSHYGNMHQL